jgi:hypothetical protein
MTMTMTMIYSQSPRYGVWEKKMAQGDSYTCPLPVVDSIKFIHDSGMIAGMAQALRHTMHVPSSGEKKAWQSHMYYDDKAPG